MTIFNDKFSFGVSSIGFTNISSSIGGAIFIINNDKDFLQLSCDSNVITLHFEDVQSWRGIYTHCHSNLFKVTGLNLKKLWNPEVIFHIWLMASYQRNVLVTMDDHDKDSILRRFNILLEMSKLRRPYSFFAGSLPPAPHNPVELKINV
ncbi:hypothetical protein AB0001_004755 [Salmonella enterica]|nr:hypothetical protein [Salmonella enterica]EEP3372987.1 hypothetical protein [Salmonella enterica]EFP6579694.1 hypothetical protein [Salmonella enterica]EGC7970976.1 hypothetical protein [Salmonella enterica]EIV4461159.1 hypothetical protein [Salmonella enterica]